MNDFVLPHIRTASYVMRKTTTREICQLEKKTSSLPKNTMSFFTTDLRQFS